MIERDAAMDDILASIRQAVADEPGADVSAESAPEFHDVGPRVAAVATAALPRLGAVEMSETSLDALIKSLLEPMLAAWLDANLPEIVDRAAQAEIARLTGRGG